jgi:hypothetical protein
MVASNHTIFAYVKTALVWVCKKEICAGYQVFVLIIFQITIVDAKTDQTMPLRAAKGTR